MNSQGIGRPRIKLPLNPFLFKQTHNLLYQLSIITSLCLIFLLLSLYYHLSLSSLRDVWWILPLCLLGLLFIYGLLDLRRRSDLTPLDEILPNAADTVAKLASKKNLMYEPPPKVFLTQANIVARAWFEKGEGFIAIGRRFLSSLGNDETLLAAILLHEMGHLKNGDINMKYINRLCVLYISMLLLGLGLWGALGGIGALFPLEGLSLALLLFLSLIWILWRAGFMAELAADLRAVLAIGDNRGLLEALRRLRLSGSAWQGGELEARETMLLNLIDPFQARLFVFFFYGFIPFISALAIFTAFSYFGEPTSELIIMVFVSLSIIASGACLYWVTEDLGAPLIALGAKAALPFVLVFILGQAMAVAVLMILFPAVDSSLVFSNTVVLLILMIWIITLLVREFKSGVAISVSLGWHNRRLVTIGFIIPICLVIFFAVITGMELIQIEPWILPSVAGIWFLAGCFWLSMESMRFLPPKTIVANWSQALAQVPPDQNIDLSSTKPLTREQEIAIGCIDLGFFMVLAGTAGLVCRWNGLWLAGLLIPAIPMLFYVMNLQGRRSLGAWFLGATARVNHKKAPGGFKAALVGLRLFCPKLIREDIDLVNVEESRLGTTGTIRLGLTLISLGLAILFLRIAEVL